MSPTFTLSPCSAGTDWTIPWNGDRRVRFSCGFLVFCNSSICSSVTFHRCKRSFAELMSSEGVSRASLLFASSRIRNSSTNSRSLVQVGTVDGQEWRAYVNDLAGRSHVQLLHVTVHAR